MKTSVPLRPPADMAPTEIFSRWLPAEWSSAGLTAPADTPRARISLRGDEGGDWLVCARHDQLTIETIPAGPTPREARVTPDVWIRQSVADFRAALAADPDLPEILPARFGVADFLFLDPRDGELVRQLDGRVALEITGRRRRRWILDAAFGPAGVTAGRARATVKLDGPTYTGLTSGELAPLKAMLERKIAIEGDRNLALQLCLLMAARLGRP